MTLQRDSDTHRLETAGGERIIVEAVGTASRGLVALRVRGARGRQIADLYLSAGDVAELERGLAAAKAALP